MCTTESIQVSEYSDTFDSLSISGSENYNCCNPIHHPIALARSHPLPVHDSCFHNDHCQRFVLTRNPQSYTHISQALCNPGWRIRLPFCLIYHQIGGKLLCLLGCFNKTRLSRTSFLDHAKINRHSSSETSPGLLRWQQVVKNIHFHGAFDVYTHRKDWLVPKSIIGDSESILSLPLYKTGNFNSVSCSNWSGKRGLRTLLSSTIQFVRMLFIRPLVNCSFSLHKRVTSL